MCMQSVNNSNSNSFINNLKNHHNTYIKGCYIYLKQLPTFRILRSLFLGFLCVSFYEFHTNFFNKRNKVNKITISYKQTIIYLSLYKLSLGSPRICHCKCRFKRCIITRIKYNMELQTFSSSERKVFI